MGMRNCLFTLLLFFTVRISATNVVNGVKADRQIKVVLRMIGHEVLLSVGDSSSRVLPIQRIGDRYQVCFETAFEFNPDALAALINRVAKTYQMNNAYLVEVEACDTENIVYSFAVGRPKSRDIIPCIGRIQPEGCYSLWFTIFDTTDPMAFLHQVPNPPGYPMKEAEKSMTPRVLLLTLLLVVAVGGFWRLKRKSKETRHNANHIPIGNYFFNHQTLHLNWKDQTMVLTPKEADLLLLLNNSVNETIERQVILQQVWGDEGNYVGRTLDVFISKLRKKFEADERVKIVNVRGVGYKLVVA